MVTLQPAAADLLCREYGATVKPLLQDLMVKLHERMRVRRPRAFLSEIKELRPVELDPFIGVGGAGGAGGAASCLWPRSRRRPRVRGQTCGHSPHTLPLPSLLPPYTSHPPCSP